jgi:pimeloyl-ACP methyl ester carboxylesterase
MREAEFERERIDYLANLGVEMKSRRLRDRAGRTIYTMERAGSGVPLVLVHGGGGDGGGWAPLIAALPAGRRVIVVDRPGHGLSYRIDYTGVSYRPAAAEFMREVVDGLGLERATLVGNSMGGYFSLCFALAHPERVERLVLMGAPAGVDRWIPPMLRLMALRPINRVLFAMMRNASREEVLEKVHAKILVADASKVPDRLLDLGMAAQALPGAELAWRTQLESVVGVKGFRRRWYIRDDVARLDVDTTFVWGDRDAFAPPSSGQDLARRMPRAKLIVVPGAGHLPWIDDPRACVAALEPSVARAQKPAAPERAQLD